MGETEFERDVKTLARRIAEAGRNVRARIYHLSFLTDRLLARAMRHPEFKTQLFRFIDVFPGCTDDADVLRHLDEYFEGIDVPGALELGLDAAEHLPFGAKITASVTRRNIIRMAHQLIAGSTPAEALPTLRALWRDGEATTVDLLGEKTVTGAEAEAYATRVHELLDTLAADAASWPPDPHLERDLFGDLPRVNVSVKPTALAPLFGPLTRDEGLREATARMHEICAHAKSLGAAVYLDMESYDVKDMTLELVRRVGEQFPDDLHLGAVVQAYLTESFDDLRSLIDWAQARRRAPLSIRLVKGAYWDYETINAAAHGWPSPVYANKSETDANYERCVRLLVSSASAVRPAFATHNIRSLAYAMTAARAARVHETAIELQLLYGMAEPVHAALRRMGMRVRAYAPVGELVPGMAYLVRRLLENTANESFLRHAYADADDLEELLRPPAELGVDVLDKGKKRPPPLNEPVAELRRPGPRSLMADAVENAFTAEAFDAPVLVDGQRIKTRDLISSVDPADPARVVCNAGRATAAEADLAIEAATRDQPAWAAAPVEKRAGVLRAAAAIMRARRHELASLEVLEAGKPWTQADADVCEAIDFCEYYAQEAMRLARGTNLNQVPGEHNQMHYVPRGIVVVISPWNFPLAIPTGQLTAPLVCGNAVLFKPAEQTPGIASRLVEILLEAGAPPGAIAYLPGIGEEVGAHLVDHPDTSVIAFTGSKDVGLHIVERASVTRPGQRHVKRVIAEMGGKNAIVVDTDADLDVAVPAIIDSAYGYAGQKCSAASRLIGIGPIFDELVERVVGAAKLVPVGPPRSMATVVGPLIDEDAYKRVRRYQEIAREDGEVVLQREDIPDTGWFAGPTVVVTTSPDARIATEEIFGPLLTCMRAESLDEALHLANLPPYALTGGVFSRLPSTIARVTRDLRAGNVYVNRATTGAVVSRQPFGGFGLSGVGSKAGGPDYLLQFVDPRVVTENTIRQGFAPQDS